MTGPVRATAAAVLGERFGLSDEELCRVLDVDPLSVIAGELDHRPELAILLGLSNEPAERLGEGILGRWLRASGPEGRPLTALLARDFSTFERALEVLNERGFVLRGDGVAPSPRSEGA